jgi:phosphoglycerate dehydrogenase-like enzyme
VSEPSAARNAQVFVGRDRPALLLAAVERAGGSLASAADANVVIWTEGGADELRSVLHPGIEWVQLALAGVEGWLDSGLVDDTRVWTSARGLYSARVAEHVVALILAAAKGLITAARHETWSHREVDLLAGATVGVVGAGGIGAETFRRLEPFGVRRIGLTRTGASVPGADLSVGPEGLEALLRESDYVVLAAPLTPETENLIGASELSLIGPRGWLVNVARGRLVDARALLDAVRKGIILGACLDVTDPEPLPDGHPLWRCDNVLITPHVANPWSRHHELLARRVAENLDRFQGGRDLLGVVDPARGY